MTNDVVFMALLMIIDPSGITTRDDTSMICSASSTPSVPPAATAIDAAAIARAPGTPTARLPEVSVAVAIMTASTTTVRPPRPWKTKSRA